VKEASSDVSKNIITAAGVMITKYKGDNDWFS
jgi:hypothetical protein